MRDEGVPPPGHAKAWAFRQINPHLRCGPAPRREEKQRLQINLVCSTAHMLVAAEGEAEPADHFVEH
jgi:hypothetical protein